METGQLKGIIEAALLAYGQPLGIEQLREIFDEFERPDASQVRKALVALADDCEGRPVELVEVASGFRLQVRKEFSARLSRLWQERPTRYSRALLETLALIAYRQPITRGEIENVRGVTVNPNIIRTLTERGWIRVVGHREVPGRPELLGTTRDFLDYFGLRSLDELPSLAALRDMDDVGIQLEFDEPVTVQAAAADQPAANDADALS
ncbi:MAG TPA: SMC-Scp complex subunit ScpB [Steroidobacteraceae bacterium]|jgi:segregation and condensation protein B|nr:SMC-Scp complex subunit ScpB [Steroidobacteraceae bacterium]